MLRKNTPISMLDDEVEVKIYDPAIKQCIDTARNYHDAKNKLGVVAITVERSCKKRTRFYSPVLKKEVACRLGKKTKADPRKLSPAH